MDHNSPPRPPTPPQGARRNPEAALMAALEGCSPSDTGSIPFQQLQKMCMRVPNLSSKLTPQLRYKLYVQLLLDKNGPPQESIPSDLAQHASQANTEPASSLGEQIRMALEATDLSKEDLVAFAWFLTRSTTFRAEDADDAALVVFMANLVRHAELPGKDALRMLLNLLRSFRDYTVPARALDFAPALKCCLHLLLQYHDPELSKHLDCLCFDLAPYILHYVQRLFLLPAAPEEDAYPIVDWILILGDPAMVPYVAVAFFVSYRQALLSASTADALHAFVRDLGVRLPSEPMEPMLADGRSVALVPLHTGKSLLQNADLLLRNTPLSAQRMLEFCLDPQDGVVKRNAEELLLYYASFPCLPVERSDLQRRFSAAGSTVAIAALQYIIIDCRSTQSFNYARLPSSIGVGDVLSIDGEALTQITERLRSVKGCHMVLLGTGRALPDEINAMKVTALHLMKDGFPYVSMSSGGFHSLIPLIRGQKIIIEMAPRSQPSLAGAAQTVSTTIQHLSGMLPSMHSDDAKVKAEELASKARDSLAVAKSWGADLLSRVQTSLASTTAPNAHATAATTSGPASSSHHPSAKPEPLQGRVVGTRTTPSASAAPTPSAEDAAAAAVFTLGTEDSDDDFDLILDPVEVQSKARQPQPAPSGAPADATSTSPDTHADIDEEFEKLFGPSA